MNSASPKPTVTLTYERARADNSPARRLRDVAHWNERCGARRQEQAKALYRLADKMEDSR